MIPRCISRVRAASEPLQQGILFPTVIFVFFPHPLFVRFRVEEDGVLVGVATGVMGLDEEEMCRSGVEKGALGASASRLRVREAIEELLDDFFGGGYLGSASSLASSSPMSAERSLFSSAQSGTLISGVLERVWVVETPDRGNSTHVWQPTC